MPIRQVRGKWYWGSKGPFDSRAKAEAVARAAYANGWREKALIRQAMAELAKYSDDQPRDEAGRWTSGGGGSLASSGSSMESHAAIAEQLGTLNSNLTKERLGDIAPEILAACDPDVLAAVIEVDNTDPNADTLPERVDPDLSPETEAVASDLADDLLVDATKCAANVNGSVKDLADALDGEMHGLQYEMKTEASLERKLGQQIELAGMTPEEAMADMKDVVRYTVVFPEGSFAESAAALIEGFQEKGFEPLKSKVTFGARAGEDTRGLLAGELIPGAALNTAWRDPGTGFPFEIQVHTPESLVAKTVSHEYYAVERVLPEDDPLVRPLTEKMVDLAATVDTPPGLDQIPTYRFVP